MMMYRLGIRPLVIAMLLVSQAAVVMAGLYEKGGALGSGGRAMGMAGAYTALAEDESSLWWNPAGLSEVSINRLGSSIDSVYDGKVRGVGIAAAIPMPKGLVSGFSWRHHFYPQVSEINTDELLLACSFPLTKEKQLHLGLGLKFLFGHMVRSGNTFSGIGLDLGLKYKLQINDQYRLFLGVHLQDIDTRISWKDEQTEQIPSRLALGTGLLIDHSTTAALDVEIIHSGQNESVETRILRLGLEHWFEKTIGIRGGYMIDNHQVSAFSFGTGIELGQVQIQYALSSQMANLGFSHRLSLSYGLPLIKQQKSVKQLPEEAFVPQLKPEVYEFELAALPEGFSPNGDGLADVVILQLDLLQGISADITGWELNITDAKGVTIRHFSGEGYPEQMEWDGADKTGKICEDGFYSLRMTVFDSKSKILGKPSEKVKIKTDLFSVNAALNTKTLLYIAGKLKRSLQILFASEAEKEKQIWQVSIKNNKGSVVRHFKGQGLLPDELQWNGTKNGRPVSDGKYQVIVEVIDSTGLRKEVIESFEIDSVFPKVSLGVSPRLLRPGHKKDGQVFFSLGTTYNQNITAWEIELKNKLTQKIIRTIRGQHELPPSIIWDGKDENNKALQGGLYLEAKLKVVYNGGGTVTGPVRTLATDLSVSKRFRALALHLTAINFEPESSVIPLDSYKNLNQAADTINRYAKNFRVHVKGHTDNLEAADRAMELSWERALKVKEYLNLAGKIPIILIDNIGYGDKLPIAPIANAAGRAKNRRVEIVLIIDSPAPTGRDIDD